MENLEKELGWNNCPCRPIKCPYALSEKSPLPCAYPIDAKMPQEKFCDEWQNKYNHEVLKKTCNSIKCNYCN